jgi:subtilisin family serine protease
VHAAGNEGKDIDTVPDYPNPYFEGPGGKSSTFLTVGANSWGPDSLVVAKFSNYGQKGVDLFAPGVRIYSTVPGNQYEEYSGTSMASPVAAGVAALLLEYYPNLSARQLEYVLIHSAMKLPDSRVKLAQTGKIVDFNSLSVSGGIINAYNAFKLASTMKGKRGKTLRMKVVHRNMD